MKHKINHFFSLKKAHQKSEFGRSMVEMLGVIGVIGLLTIFGILGYQYASAVYQAHTIVDTMTKAKALTATKQIKTDADLAFFMDKQLLAYQPRVIENANPLQIDLDSVSSTVSKHVLKSQKAPYIVKVQDGNIVGLSFIFDGVTLNNKGYCSDRCQAGETTNPANCGSDGIAQKTHNTSCGSPCYKCINNTCPSGTSTFCPSSSQAQEVTKTTDGTPCYACLTDDCPTGLARTCAAGTVAEEVGQTTKGNPCYLCKTDSCPAGQSLSCPAGQEATQVSTTSSGRPCYTCAEDICPDGTQKTCNSNQLKTQSGKTAAGTQCYTCSDCPIDKPIYDTTTNSCVTCTEELDCRYVPNVPHACGIDNGDPDPLLTPVKYTCFNNQCVEKCTTSGECPCEKPVCNTSTSRCENCTSEKPYWNRKLQMCIECQTNTDCSGSKPICNVNNGACEACPSATPYWSDTLSKCVSCLNNSNCSDNTPVCNTTAGICEACSPDKPIYDQETRQCVQCISETEGCNPDSVRFVCPAPGIAAPIPPVIQYKCYNNQCVQKCVTNANCSCGTPICDTSTGVCQGCPFGKPVWDANTQTCGPCLSNSDCGGDSPSCNLETGECKVRKVDFVVSFS